MLKPTPVIAAPVIITFWFPVLAMVAVSVLSWLTSTLPKARLVGAAESVIVAELPVTNWYAPISKAEPCGRGMPSKSVASPLMVTPASMAGLPGCKWKSGFARDRFASRGSTFSESVRLLLAGGAPWP